MKKQVVHTETPWKYDGQNYIFGPNNEMVAEIRGWGAKLPMDSNAAFIVKAANSYDRMLGALEDAQKMGITLMDEVCGQKATDWKVVNEAMLAIEACLRKARAK